jgi:hypothetical protein
MNVDALAPARVFDREVLLLRRPEAHGPRRVGGMHRVDERGDLVGDLWNSTGVRARDERPLRFRVELARDDLGLVIFQPQAMQQRDQSRAALVDEAELLGDPGSDLPRRSRQGGADSQIDWHTCSR